jgi:hypothetical protein
MESKEKWNTWGKGTIALGSGKIKGRIKILTKLQNNILAE